MTHKELVIALSEKLGWTQAKVTDVITQVVGETNKQLANNKTVTIKNFGVFQTRKKLERISVNPKTKERFLIPPKISVSFKPSSVLKEKFK